MDGVDINGRRLWAGWRTNIRSIREDYHQLGLLNHLTHTERLGGRGMKTKGVRSREHSFAEFKFETSLWRILGSTTKVQKFNLFWKHRGAACWADESRPRDAAPRHATPHRRRRSPEPEVHSAIISVFNLGSSSPPSPNTSLQALIV